MSLETAIAANTAAILELTAVWAKLAAQGNAVDKSDHKELTAAGKPVKATPEKAAKEAAAPAPTPVTAAAAPAAPVESSTASSELKYDDVAKAITSFVAKHGRDAAITKLGELGVKSGKELKPEQYAAAVEAFKV